MPPKTRVDIIVGKMKPMGDKPMMKMERAPDAKQSSDFVQEIDMDEHDVMYEAAGEAVMQAIKQHDAKALADAICDLIDLHTNQEPEQSDEESSGEEY